MADDDFGLLSFGAEGEWELEPARGDLRRSGQVEPIRPKPLAVLVHLIRHRDRFVSKHELLEALWPGVSVSETALTSAVKAVRRVLHDDGERQAYIETRRGRGYRFTAPVREGPSVASPSPADDFVGRAEALHTLDRALEAALVGRGGLVLVRGEAGIGKTRLLAELEWRLRARGVPAVHGWCGEETGHPPFWPWHQLVSRLRPEQPLADDGHERADTELPAVLSALSAEADGELLADPSQGHGARLRLFEAVCRLLRASARPRGLVMLLDDLHAADDASLQLLAFLARELAGSRLLLVAAAREPATAPSRTLAQTQAVLARCPECETITLEGLDSDDSHELARRTAPHTSDSDLESVVRRAAGNPFYLRALARTATSERVPVVVRDALRGRFERLSPLCLEVLAAAAVVGRDFSPELVSRALERGLAEVEAALREAAQEGLVAESANGYAFDHAIVAETLRAEQGRARLSELHLRIGEALERDARDPDPDRLARHFREAGASAADRAVEHSRRAGRRAMRLLAFEDAAAHFERALRALELVSSPDLALRGDLLTHLGGALAAAGGPLPEVTRVLVDAGEIAQRRADGSALARAVLALAGLPVVSGDLAPLLEEALRLRPGVDDELSVGIRSRLALELLFQRRPDRARELVASAVETAERLGHPAALGAALTAKLVAAGYDPPAERLEIGRRIVEAAEAAGVPALATIARGRSFFARLELGDPEAARDSESFARFLERQPAAQRRAMLPRQRAVLGLLAGDLDAADRHAAEALAIARREGNRIGTWMATLAGALCRRERGECEGLERTYLELAELLPRGAFVRCGLVDLYVRLDRGAEAAAELGALRGEEIDAMPLASRPLAAGWLAEACWALGDQARAEELLAWIEPALGLHLVGTEGSLYLGSAARAAGLLAWTLGRLSEAERLLRQGLDENESAGAALWAAHARCDLARLLIARGARDDRESALQLLDEAETWADQRPVGALRADLRSARLEADGAIPLRGRRGVPRGGASPGMR